MSNGCPLAMTGAAGAPVLDDLIAGFEQRFDGDLRRDGSREGEAEVRESVEALVVAAPGQGGVLGDHAIGIAQLEDGREVAGGERVVDTVDDLNVRHAGLSGSSPGGWPGCAFTTRPRRRSSR